MKWWIKQSKLEKKPVENWEDKKNYFIWCSMCMKDNIQWALLILLATAIRWSTGVFVKFMHLPSTTIVAFRLGIPLICVTAYLLYKRRKIGLSRRLPWKYSARNAVRMLLYYIWFNLTTVANAVIGLYTWPLFAAIIEFYRTRKITPIVLFCTLLGLGGVIVTCLDKSFWTAPLQLVWFLSITVSAMISAIQRFRQKDIMEYADNIQMILYQALVGGVLFFPFLFINKPTPTIHQSSIAIVFSVLIGVAWFFLYFKWLRKISIAYMSILSYFEVIAAILFAYFIIHEVPSGYTLAWWALIILSIVIISINKNKTQTITAE